VLYADHFKNPAEKGRLKEDFDFVAEMATSIPEDAILPLQRIVCGVIRSFYREVLKDKSLLKQLALIYQNAWLKALSAPLDKQLEWMSDAALIRSYMMNVERTTKCAHRFPNGAAVQLYVLGIPISFSRKAILADASVKNALDDLGIHAICQPNSVIFSRTGVDKGTVLRYLQRKYGFDPKRSISLADNPESIDHPLATYPDMCFVSVSNRSPSWVKFHLGGLENGTADFLISLLKKGRPPPNALTAIGEDEGAEFDPRYILSVLSSCKKRGIVVTTSNL
jgi:hypothetical protein